MLRLAIVDDDKEFVEDFSQEIEEVAKECKVKLDIVGFYSGKSFLQEWREEGNLEYDLVFLDIDMPGLLGIDLGEEIRKEYSSRDLSLVYISSYPSYSMDLHPLEIMDFLIKFYNSETKRLEVDPGSLQRILEKKDKEKEKTRVWFTYVKDHRKNEILAKNILYFDMQNKEVTMCFINTISHREEKIVFNDSIKKIMERLPKEDFTRIHRQILVNEEHVEKKSNKEWLMKNGESLPVGRSFQLRIFKKEE